MYRHILIATDGSELSARAVDQGIKLARTIGARVTGADIGQFVLADRDGQAAAPPAARAARRHHVTSPTTEVAAVECQNALIIHQLLDFEGNPRRVFSRLR